MTNDFEKVFDAAAETQDYTGGDGLLYCGSCRTPKQFRMDKPPMEGRLLPAVVNANRLNTIRRKRRESAGSTFKP